jgi:hypothetical protein
MERGDSGEARVDDTQGGVLPAKVTPPPTGPPPLIGGACDEVCRESRGFGGNLWDLDIISATELTREDHHLASGAALLLYWGW